jgi:hypothetical protein
MWGLFLLLVLAAAVANVAGGLQLQGVRWAYQVCSATGGLCDYSDQVTMTTLCAGLMYLALRVIRHIGA